VVISGNEYVSGGLGAPGGVNVDVLGAAMRSVGFGESENLLYWKMAESNAAGDGIFMSNTLSDYFCVCIYEHILTHY